MKAENRLKKRGSFTYVYRKGTKTNGEYVRLCKAPSKEGLKIGISVSKKIGNAVHRNKLKRQIRAIIAKRIQKIDEKFLYVIVPNEKIADKTFEEIEKIVDNIFEKAEAYK